jgi:hypothetical protein
MQSQFAGSQQPPLTPQPLQPRFGQAQGPMVYVYEPQRWEYKIVVKTLDGELPSEEELNALGREGWELAGTATLLKEVQFFFKRLRH